MHRITNSRVREHPRAPTIQYQDIVSKIKSEKQVRPPPPKGMIPFIHEH